MAAQRLTRRPLALAITFTSLIALSGCSFFADDPLVDDSPKLAALEPARVPEVKPLVADTELLAVQQRYQRALDVAEDERIKRDIYERLAELSMLRAEQKLLEGTEDPAPYFREVITQYEALLAVPMDEHYDPATRQEAIYQLAKAHALMGNTEASDTVLTQLTEHHPEGDFVAEAQFRRAESAFSAGDYVAAANHYQSVIDAGPATPYYLNATYMHGWAMFKRGWYPQSLDSFTSVLDKLLPAGSKAQELSSSNQNLLNDSLRIMAVTFSYLDGADTIEQTYVDIGKRHYHHMLYESLGQLYLEKERYRDSADTYGHYVANNPLDEHSPNFSVRQIEVYGQGNFPSLILPAKEDYVRNYGFTSSYWADLSDTEREPIRKHLHSFLDELASYEHASAQQAQADIEKLKPAERAKALPELEAKRAGHYAQAALWYSEFISTFPEDAKTPEMAFLMGEALFEADKLEAAFAAFEKVAYQYKDATRGPEAGYSAILSATKIGERDTLNEQDRIAWQDLKIASSLRFAQSFPTDTRAAAVLTQAANELLAQGKPQDAIAAAVQVTQWQPEPDAELRKTAWLVLAQSYYDTEQYESAEYAYNQVLTFLPARDPMREDIKTRIAASVYKRSEQLIAAGSMALAVEQLIRVQSLAPDSDIAISAQYDAASYLIELKRWEEAEQLLVDFRSRYPNHSLTASITPKMVLIYEQSENWSAAAEELLKQARNSQDPALQQQSLYIAAEYYERDGNTENAINFYREYAHNYPEPFNQNLEAQYKLSELYLAQGNIQNRDYWLRKIIETDRTAGDQRTDRSITLAAMATSVRADDFYKSFESIALNLPLKQSLAKKKKALQDTLDMYQALLKYGVAEYTTQASHRIGAIYAQLSRDLMDSQRPRGLDELELEQYEILLEEQAFPFEEQAIEIFEANAQRAWSGTYDEWVKHSFAELARLLPARYRKQEAVLEYSDVLH
ncbi:tetratricopeptide repeat protein [Simiduia sp. 21SJ11W-1]|uniref:tetratricopeptide repeat protein n=1 Tax=Simiduia sp. 21SJ11W-1 TaxID=2909669 RepID=UPI00209DD3DC|nr:tetratricopeptide repeat protein [Simiduia sp. 21SJ11W-1]UTA47873.1 tetratricopeptide repeat protein [Simiduia sp. 21SJ11W-1]